ncbi:unnamed protein product, partial [Nesidiocoris tenuis]
MHRFGAKTYEQGEISLLCLPTSWTTNLQQDRTANVDPSVGETTTWCYSCCRQVRHCRLRGSSL